MKKADLLRRIEELERRVEELERRVALLEASRVIYPFYPTYPNPYPWQPWPVITWQDTSAWQDCSVAVSAMCD